MNEDVDLDRVKYMDLSKAKIGDQIMYCRDCNHQMEPNEAGPVKCYCGSHLRIITVSQELISINILPKETK